MFTGIICAFAAILCLICGVSDWRKGESQRAVLNAALTVFSGFVSAASFTGITIL
ncbi:hypothetical protein [Marinobacterium sp. BA1]|uniref:hypothetical protein n=1 Tax=Marinobacterium sp. BA1 TaxID=3138931 RepID=UPI0034E86311